MNNKKGEKIEEKVRKTVKLDLVHSYGASFGKNLLNCCFYVEHVPRRLIYPIGRYLALKDLFDSDRKYQIKFIRLHEKVTKFEDKL